MLLVVLLLTMDERAAGSVREIFARQDVDVCTGG
jgi:hypothetical protein